MSFSASRLAALAARSPGRVQPAPLAPGRAGTGLFPSSLGNQAVQRLLRSGAPVIQRQAEDAGPAPATEESPTPQRVNPVHPRFCPGGRSSCYKECANDAFGIWIDCFEKNVRPKPEGKEREAARQKCDQESDAWKVDCQIRRCDDCL